MEFAFSQEQQMIRDTAEAFLKASSSSARVRSAMVSATGFDADLWTRISQEMMWPAIHIPEQYGGLGLGYVEQVAIFEQMGRYLLCSPYFSTVALACNALLQTASHDQQSYYFEQILAGKTASLAATGIASEKACDTNVTYVANEHGFLLNGRYAQVIDGASAELLILAAQHRDSAETSLFICEPSVVGLQPKTLATMDQTRRIAELELSNLQLPPAALLGTEGQAAALQKTLDLAAIALAAEQLGGMQQCLDAAVDYARERQQFNRPIAGFQAVKHLAADMMLRSETARSAVYYAACIADDALQQGPLANELCEAASIAKSWCSEAYFKNASDALQIHGGVGFTWEYDIHLYFKRAKASQHLLGDSDHHRERVAQGLLDGAVLRSCSLAKRMSSSGKT